MLPASDDFEGYPDAATLIADTGHPQFPGWEVIAAILMAATISLLISGDIEAALRRRAERQQGGPSSPITKTTTAANAVRFAPQRRTA